MNLAIIDVQPGYRQGADYVRNKLIPLLNKGTYENIVFVRVNEELSGDAECDAMAYWEEAGLDPEVLANAQHVEKTYAFFRGWMDNGVADDVIVSTVKHLRSENKWDTRDLDAEVLESFETGLSERWDPLLRPYELESVAPLFQRKEWTLCGGGRYECLKEFELWLESLDIPYERLEHLVYG